MRKYTLLAIIALAATFASAKYNYMEFVTDDGASLYISADNLSITIDGDKVTGRNGSATTTATAQLSGKSNGRP